MGLHRHGGRRRAALREGPACRPDDPVRGSHIRAVGDPRPGVPLRPWRRADRLCARRPDRAAVGWSRSDLPAAPRDLQHQLAVSLLRAPRLRDGRRVAKPGVAGDSDLGRGVAQQPPCLPDVLSPWSSPLATRPFGGRDSRAGDGWAGLGRGARGSRPDPAQGSSRSDLRTGLPFASSAPLTDELRAALPRRPFAVRFWDGGSVEATEPDAPTLVFRSPRALAHVLRAPGELGIGRAYVDGLVEVDDLDAALLMVDSFEAPPLSQIGRASCRERV